MALVIETPSGKEVTLSDEASNYLDYYTQKVAIACFKGCDANEQLALTLEGIKSTGETPSEELKKDLLAGITEIINLANEEF